MTEYTKKILVSELMDHFSYPKHLNTMEWKSTILLLLDKMETINPQDLEKFLNSHI